MYLHRGAGAYICGDVSGVGSTLGFHFRFLWDQTPSKMRSLSLTTAIAMDESTVSSPPSPVALPFLRQSFLHAVMRGHHLDDEPYGRRSWSKVANTEGTSPSC
ncbi:hypothetical protein HGRIS_005488 [Hohenbuehelia grisea]|uniref:Uncharacterized protein n=1 Tax=Hohenbuehelia grisea TaxID=104357 RepID=A0ABR3JZA7_9AGAR